MFQHFVSDTSFIAIYGASYGVVLFLLSVGLAITLGLMRIVNLAHGAFAAFGGYLCVSLMTKWGVPFFLAAVLAALVVAAASLLIERAVYRSLYGAPELDQVLMTVGIVFLAIAALNLMFGPDLLAAKLPAALNGSFDLGVRSMPIYRLVVVGVGAVVVLGLWFLFDRTDFGARLRAAVDNRSMAETIGIDVNRLFATSFALGSGLAALGGAIGFAMLPLEPMYPFKYLTLILIIVTLAGMGNTKASAAVALLVGVVDTAARYLVPEIGAFVVYLMFVVLIIWRPRGILKASHG